MKKSAVILVYPQIRFEDNYPCSWIPYSILSIASAIKKNRPNIEVVVFDENRNYIDGFNEMLNKTYNILCIGYSIMTGGGQIGHALELADFAKKANPSIINVFGGPHVNVLPIQTLNHSLVDIVISGPGQKSFPLLIDAIEGKISYDSVPGLSMYVSGQVVRGPENILDANTLVPYDFQFIDCNDYIRYDSTISNRTINYISSQGCVYKCKFCYETNYKRKYARLPCDRIIQDLQYFVREHGVDGIKFYDADWFINSKKYELLINALTELNLSWAASIHPKDILRAINNGEQLLAQLATSNCKRLLMGIESGSNRVLNEVVDKGVTKEEIFFVAEEIAKYGILGSYTFIVGFPGETTSEQEETFDFIRDLWKLNPRPETRVHIYTPYPGTALYEKALSMSFIPPNSLEKWSSFDYYKSNTPWTDDTLEQRVKNFTLQIPKNEDGNI